LDWVSQGGRYKGYWHAESCLLVAGPSRLFGCVSTRPRELLLLGNLCLTWHYLLPAKCVDHSAVPIGTVIPLPLGTDAPANPTSHSSDFSEPAVRPSAQWQAQTVNCCQTIPPSPRPHSSSWLGNCSSTNLPQPCILDSREQHLDVIRQSNGPVFIAEQSTQTNKGASLVRHNM
jgi:hypothetical protein